jgi:hypothetical protein
MKEIIGFTLVLARDFKKGEGRTRGQEDKKTRRGEMGDGSREIKLKVKSEKREAS